MTRTIYVVERHWYEESTLLAAFESEADAGDFIEYEKGYGGRWHYTVRDVELHPPASPPQSAVEMPVAVSPAREDRRDG